MCRVAFHPGKSVLNFRFFCLLQVLDSEPFFAETELFWEIITLCKRIVMPEKLNILFKIAKRVKLICSLKCHVARHTHTSPRVATKGPYSGSMGEPHA